MTNRAARSSRSTARREFPSGCAAAIHDSAASLTAPGVGAIVSAMTTIAAVPPHNLEAERSVLGAILLTGQQALEPIALEEHLQPEHFYREQHALVYTAMLALHQRHEPIDTLTVADQLIWRDVCQGLRHEFPAFSLVWWSVGVWSAGLVAVRRGCARRGSD